MTPVSKKSSIEVRMCAVSEDVLFFAFRYALGRRTPAVMAVTDAIRMNISNIKLESCRQMIKEINEAKQSHTLGDACDIEEWDKVCELLGKKTGNR